MDKYLFFAGKCDSITDIGKERASGFDVLSVKVNKAIEHGYQVIEIGQLTGKDQPLWVAMIKVEK